MQLRIDSEQNLAADVLASVNASGSDLRIDASQAIFFARELLRVRARAFEIQFPELKALNFVPRNTELTAADETYTYQTYEMVGQVGTRAGYTKRGPRADVVGAEADPAYIKPLTASYGYDLQELRASMQHGKRLPERKARAARTVIAQEIDSIMAVGGTILGRVLTGLASLSGTLTYTTPTGVGGTKYWTGANGKTPAEVITDMHGMANQIVTNSNEVEVPDTMLLPLAAYMHISQTRMGDGSDDTILTHFMKNSKYVKTVEPWYKLDSNTGWTGGRAITYQRNPDKLEALLPIEFEQLAPQQSAFETLVDCHARLGGVIAYYPKSINYADEITP